MLRISLVPRVDVRADERIVSPSPGATKYSEGRNTDDGSGPFFLVSGLCLSVLMILGIADRNARLGNNLGLGRRCGLH